MLAAGACRVTVRVSKFPVADCAQTGWRHQPSVKARPASVVSSQPVGHGAILPRGAHVESERRSIVATSFGIPSGPLCTTAG